MSSAAISFVAAHAAVLLLLALTARAAGRLARFALTAASVGRAGIATGSALDTALGLVVLATLGCLLGLAGQLRPAPLLAVAAAIHLAALGSRRAGAAPGPLAASPPSRREITRGGLALAAIAPLFALALYPPTAFDETLYHLPFARAFAGTGSLPFLPELRFPVFPQLAEVLAAEVLMVAGDAATHLVQLLAILLTAALLVAWGREWGADDGPRPVAGWLAAAVWLGNPLVVYLGGTGYVEPLLALFVTAGCWAFWRWRREGGRHWLALAATFAGAAAATKYLGLYFVLALVLATLIPRSPAMPGPEGVRAGRLRHLLLAAGVALAVMAPWYGRILAHTGNPVFPYLPGLFGDHAWMPVRFRTLAPPADAADAIAGLARAGARLATLPWDVVARRHLVGGMPPLSPVYLATIPLLAVAWVRDRSLRPLLTLAAGFVSLFPALPADTRYLVTVLPLASLGVGVVAARLLARVPWGRRPAAPAALALLLALPGWLYAGYRLGRQGPPPTTPAAREAYLLRALPLYPAVARLNRVLRPGDLAYGLHAEQMRDHVRGDFLGDWYGPRRYGALNGLLDEPAELRAVLRSWGVDFLLVARGSAFQEFAPGPEAGFELLYADGAASLYALRPAGAGGGR